MIIRWTHASLRTQFLVALSAIAVTLVVTLGVFVGDRERQRLEEGEETLYRARLGSLESSMLESVAGDDSAVIQEILIRTGEQDEGIAHLRVTNRFGAVLGDWHRAGVTPDQTLRVMQQNVVVEGDPLGTIELKLDPRPLEREVRIRVREVQAALTMSLLLMVLCVGCLIYQLAIRPLRQIDQRVRLLREGTAVAPLGFQGACELENVASAIDALAEQTRLQRASDLAHHRELERLNASYYRFVPKQLLSLLNRDSFTEVLLGDQRQGAVTVLFCDIRSFTSMSERLGAEATFAFINDFLGRLGPVVRKHGGFIDKYMGDSIMALFTSPAAALDSGVEMQRVVAKINEEQGRQGGETIRIGIGVNSGTVMLGVIGEDERLEGTVIGDVVNLASRLEELTKKYLVSFLFGQDTLDALAADGHAGGGNRWAYRYVGLVQAKGREALTPVYELLSADPPDVIERKLRLARWRSSQLEVPPTERSMPPADLENDPLYATYWSEVLGMPVPSGSREVQPPMSDECITMSAW